MDLWIAYTAGCITLGNGIIFINGNLTFLQITVAIAMILFPGLGDVYRIAGTGSRLLNSF